MRRAATNIRSRLTLTTFIGLAIIIAGVVGT
ncbi:MAG: hypothetical protein QOG62_1897, partial [Thermoleophilaceae bacterium]|nr:hypothetical protein [Thermoleophilaceae bacterium]